MSDESNLGLVISLGFLSLIITLFALFGEQIEIKDNPVFDQGINKLANSMTYYHDHPTELIYNPFFLFIVVLIIMPFIRHIVWGLGYCVYIIKPNKKSVLPSEESA